MNDMVQRIARLISAARIDLSDEKRAQCEVEELFTKNGIEFQREFRLSAGEIPDFMIQGIAVEMKMRGARKKSIFKQLERYAAHDSVKALILITNLTMGLPDTINGKPVYFVPLARGWM